MNKQLKKKVLHFLKTVKKAGDSTQKCLESSLNLLDEYGKTQEVDEVIFRVRLLIAENESVRRMYDDLVKKYQSNETNDYIKTTNDLLDDTINKPVIQ